MDIKTIVKEKPELSEYLFVRGFLLSTDSNLNIDDFPFCGNWNKTIVNDSFCAYTHNWQKFTMFDKDGVTFFVFGSVYNPFTMKIDETEILERIAEKYFDNEYQDAIDEITGIFVTGYISNGEIHYQVDPSGMQSAYSGIANDNFYLTSHPQIVGDLCDLKMTEIAKELTEYKWYYRVMGAYMPADLSPFDEIKRVVPDIEYIYDGKTISHKRFYPLKDLKEVANESEYNEVINKGAEILKNNMQLVSEKWDKPYISLTGGIDSNTTFAAANGIYDKFKVFNYVSAEKETIDAEAAEKIAKRFNVERLMYNIPESTEGLSNYDEMIEIINHNNGYVIKHPYNEYRKRVFLIENLDCDVEVKSWTSETIRAYWYKHYGRKSFPKLSPKLFRNLYKIFIFNRPLAHKVDKLFAQYINDFEYDKIPAQYPPADMHYNEVTWGSWGGMNISEMKVYADITIIYNNRKFLDLMFRVPLDKRISDQHHLDMKKVLNKELYDMHIRVVNMKETAFRAFMLNVIFTINSILPF
ncbi:MAG: hypothetical protein IJS03_06915 [Eubacterium sp.]|nr:hypothetical protein [Eubacterium sp.]